MRQPRPAAYGCFEDEPEEAPRRDSEAPSSADVDDAEVGVVTGESSRGLDDISLGDPEEQQTGHAASVSSATSSRWSTARRLILVPIVAVGLAVLGKVTGAEKYLHRDRVKELMAQAGVLGWLAYIAIFAFGELIHIPGVVFVAAAVFSYGEIAGAALAYVGSLASVSCGFLVARSLSGGVTLDSLGLPDCAQKRLDSMAEAPVRSTGILRLVFYLSPAINTALGVTKISFKDYFLGSALGLIPMTILVTLCIDWLIEHGII